MQFAQFIEILNILIGIPLLTFEFIELPIGVAVTPVGDLRRLLRLRRKDRCRFDDHGFGQIFGVKSQDARCQ